MKRIYIELDEQYPHFFLTTEDDAKLPNAPSWVVDPLETNGLDVSEDLYVELVALRHAANNLQAKLQALLEEKLGHAVDW